MLTKDFSENEMKCPCCGECNMDHMFMFALQFVRDTVEKPMVINSGFRCNARNALVGGSLPSRHLSGDAADISTVGWGGEDLWCLITTLTNLGFSIGVYKNHIHIDSRPMPISWVSL